MGWLRESIFRIQPLFRGRKLDAELSDELRIHLEMATEANIAAGMTRAEAEAAAAREFGRFEAIKQDYRDERGLSWVEHLVQDLTFGARLLRKNPVFTVVVVVTLALGIGVNNALFSTMNALLLRPLPVPQPERLVGLYRKAPGDRSYHRISYPDYVALRDRTGSFGGLAAYHFTPMHFSAAGSTSRIWGQVVTDNYFSTLGVNLSGPGFSPSRAGSPEARPEVVLSHAFWRNRFAADPAVVGRAVTLNGVSFSVVGVAPESFRDLEAWLAPDVWAPMSMQPQILPGSNRLQAEGYSWLRVVGRLRAGVTVPQAQAEVSAVAARIRGERGSSAAAEFVIVPDVGLHPELRPMVRGLLLMLMAIAGIVLLMVCVNLTTLWLARSMTRWKEMGTRLALGATRGRLFRQMITESLMLAAIGGILALLITPLLVRGIEVLQAASPVPAPVSFALDYRVFVFSGLVALLTGVVFGSVPAWCAAKTDLLSVLKHGSPHSGMKPSTWRNAFVALQIAASFVLLVCGALFVRSLHRQQHIDLGFEPRPLLALSYDLGLQGYSPDRGRAFCDEAQRAVGAIAGVEATSVSHFLPLSPWSEDTRIWFGAAGDAMANFDFVDPDYFRTLGLPLIRGRSFSDADHATSAPVVLVNETLARMIAPEGDVLNRTLRLDPGGNEHRIVGVARDSKYVTLGEPPRPFVYFPRAQNYRSATTLIVRTSGDPAVLLGAVVRAVQNLDPDLPVHRASTMPDHVQQQLFVPQWAAVLITGFAGLAFLLALLGIFGVTTYDATQRTREIGVRIALGARRADIVRIVVGGGLRVLAVGGIAGIAGALATTHLVRAYLHGVSPLDVPSYVLAAGVLGGAVLLACYLPARRATAIAPADALRHE